MDSMLFRLLTAALEPGAGLFADLYGFLAAFTGMALICGVMMLVLMVFRGRVHKRTEMIV
jgi:hypothetical protein